MAVAPAVGIPFGGMAAPGMGAPGPFRTGVLPIDHTGMSFHGGRAFDAALGLKMHEKLASGENQERGTRGQNDGLQMFFAQEVDMIGKSESTVEMNKLVKASFVNSNSKLFELFTPIYAPDEGIWTQDTIKFMTNIEPITTEKVEPRQINHSVMRTQDHTQYGIQGFAMDLKYLRTEEGKKVWNMLLDAQFGNFMVYMHKSIVKKFFTVPSYYRHPHQLYPGIKPPRTVEDVIQSERERFGLGCRDARAFRKIEDHARAILAQGGGDVGLVLGTRMDKHMFTRMDETQYTYDLSGSAAIMARKRRREDTRAGNDSEQLTGALKNMLVLPFYAAPAKDRVNLYDFTTIVSNGSFARHINNTHEIEPEQYYSWMLNFKMCDWHNNGWMDYPLLTTLRHCMEFVPLLEDTANPSANSNKSNIRWGRIDRDALIKLSNNVKTKDPEKTRFVHKQTKTCYKGCEWELSVFLRFNENFTHRLSKSERALRLAWYPVDCYGELDERTTPTSDREFTWRVFAARITAGWSADDLNAFESGLDLMAELSDTVVLPQHFKNEATVQYCHERNEWGGILLDHNDDYEAAALGGYKGYGTISGLLTLVHDGKYETQLEAFITRGGVSAADQIRINRAREVRLRASKFLALYQKLVKRVKEITEDHVIFDERLVEEYHLGGTNNMKSLTRWMIRMASLILGPWKAPTVVLRPHATTKNIVPAAEAAELMWLDARKTVLDEYALITDTKSGKLKTLITKHKVYEDWTRFITDLNVVLAPSGATLTTEQKDLDNDIKDVKDRKTYIDLFNDVNIKIPIGSTFVDVYKIVFDMRTQINVRRDYLRIDDPLIDGLLLLQLHFSRDAIRQHYANGGKGIISVAQHVDRTKTSTEVVYADPHAYGYRMRPVHNFDGSSFEIEDARLLGGTFLTALSFIKLNGSGELPLLSRGPTGSVSDAASATKISPAPRFPNIYQSIIGKSVLNNNRRFRTGETALDEWDLYCQLKAGATPPAPVSAAGLAAYRAVLDPSFTLSYTESAWELNAKKYRHDASINAAPVHDFIIQNMCCPMTGSPAFNTGEQLTDMDIRWGMTYGYDTMLGIAARIYESQSITLQDMRKKELYHIPLQMNAMILRKNEKQLMRSLPVTARGPEGITIGQLRLQGWNEFITFNPITKKIGQQKDLNHAVTLPDSTRFTIEEYTGGDETLGGKGDLFVNHKMSRFDGAQAWKTHVLDAINDGEKQGRRSNIAVLQSLKTGRDRNYRKILDARADFKPKEFSGRLEPTSPSFVSEHSRPMYEGCSMIMEIFKFPHETPHQMRHEDMSFENKAPLRAVNFVCCQTNQIIYNPDRGEEMIESSHMWGNQLPGLRNIEEGSSIIDIESYFEPSKHLKL